MTLSQNTVKMETVEWRDDPVKGWDLFEPLHIFETKKLSVFNHFMNSKGTTNIELVRLTSNMFTICIKGGDDIEKSTVYFSQLITNISRPDRISMVDGIYSHPGIPNIVKNRIGATLAAYFGVEKETDK